MSSRWYLLLLSMSRCLYGRSLLLTHSSYLVVLLPPPMVLSLVPLLGQCGLWYSVHCRIARCRIPLWSYLKDFSTLLLQECDQSVLACLRTFFRLFDAMIFSRMISWLYILMSSHAFFSMVLHMSAVFFLRHFSSFHHQGSCWG